MNPLIKLILPVSKLVQKSISNLLHKRYLSKMANQVYDNDKFKAVRLPDFLIPNHYELKLNPDIEKLTFEGTVKILFSRRELKDDPVVLNATELVIHEGYLEAGSNKNVLTTVTYSKDAEVASLDFGGKYPERGSIFLKFSGTLNDKMKGFYRSTFKLDGKQEVAATTQFEACDARRCFPCWDEPDKKATFKVTLQYKDVPSREAISNMPVISDTVANGERVRTFDVSPIMSTYLLAFVIGPFEYLEMLDKKNRPIRVYTTPGKKEQGRYALEVGCKSLAFYEEYFGIEYPLPKLDMIAIPDFANGAMENWGLITYRETCMLVDPANTSTALKQNTALVVAHEIAHQWFGNLVTMEWWTHLWLNEGFATFMEFKCVHEIFPEYDIWSQFVTDSYSRAMELDSLHNSHPIEVPVKHPSEIDEIFDIISYEKGSSVIRMLFNYIGDEHFRKGMKQYLTKFSYKNARTEDLWDSLEAASNKPIRRLMSGWTSQKGFPWLSVSTTKEGADVKLTLRQDKFSADGQLQAGDSDASWLVPIQVITGTNPAKVIDLDLLDKKEGVFKVEGAGENWIKLNPGTIGLYRTAYPVEMSQKLRPAISDKSLSSVDRLGLQNDYLALCQAGKVKTVDLLKLLGAFKSETDYPVWSSIDSCIGRLNMLLSNTDYQDKFHAFGRELYDDIFQKLTWSPRPNEKHTDGMERALVLGRLVTFGHQEVVAESRRLYKVFLSGGEPIQADVRGAVYRAVAVYGDDADFDSLLELYRKSELQEERNRIARALGSSAKDLKRAKKVFDFALSDEVKNQDKLFVIIAIAVTNPLEGWRFLQEHKDLIREIYANGTLLGRLVKYCTENFASEEKAQEISKFFEENKFPGAERTIQQSIETIRLSKNWLERDSGEIKVFLSS